MKQLLLEISPDFTPTLDNFVAGRNVEVLQALSESAAGAQSERFVYLWGEPSSGKTHLLHAFVEAVSRRGLKSVYVQCGAALPDHLEGYDAVALDDVGQLDGEGQIALFNLYNRLREGQGRLLTSGQCAPARLPMRPDVVTRLGWGLIYQIHGLSDDEKVQALHAHAASRGFRLGAGVAEYLLRHWRRDLPSLLGALDTLDHYSLETKRPITVPLLRETLHLDV
ncbi:MAG: DnaA regulatory inactivator Hda [Gammaproteobacteria bacterium]|nr:DnaA regulatory inactivator Hda [Gammaproteobacteria bacterium]MBU1978246.1 DnaA regulatory inactivator Hda [Gammaproteobacteria bacterium]